MQVSTSDEPNITSFRQERLESRLRGKLNLRTFCRLVFEPHAIGVADQAMVSATSFLTTVIIAHFSNPGQLGTYSIAISVIASAYTFQGQLISLPYSIQRDRQSGTSEEHAGSSLVLAVLFASLFTLLLVVTASGLVAAPAHDELLAITWALAGIIPFALLRDFSRRFSLAHLEMAPALALDSATAIVQVGMLVWLGVTGHMSAVTASVALGASCALSGLGWLYVAHSRFAVRADHVRETMKQCWKLGKWLGLNQIMVQAQRFSPYWLCAVILGASLTGILSACMSFVGLMNPLVYGLNNVLTQKSVLAWKEGGSDGLRRQTRRDVLSLGAALAPFCILALWVGEDIVHLLYPGPEYEGRGEIISVLVFATVIWALSNPPSNALASMERTRLIFGINVAAVILMGALVGGFTASFGLLGAAYGWLIGNLLLTCTLWIGFLQVVQRAGDGQSILQVLPHLAQTKASEVSITKLGEGAHAKVYAVRSTTDQPVWGTYRCVVAKIYKPKAGLSPELAAEQFVSVSRLNNSTDGRTVNGWTISTPKPLYIRGIPLALVMTQIAGKHDLRASMGVDPDLTPETLQELAKVVVLGLKEAWSRGEIHGDLALQNVLYSVQTKELSFIDPGTRDCCVVCNSDNLPWQPAVLELGHILRDFGTDMRDLTGRPNARTQKSIFTKSALLTYLETIVSVEEKLKALKDIRNCALFHLSKVLEASWMMRGLARGPLTRFVVRRIDALLAEILKELTMQATTKAAAPQFRCVEEDLDARLPACSAPAICPECAEPDLAGTHTKH